MGEIRLLKLEISLYILTVIMWIPSLFSIALGNCLRLCFWDFYQSYFILLSLFAFFPFSYVIVNFSRRVNRITAFLFGITGIWWIVLSMPDWIMGNLSPEYQEIYFAVLSFIFFAGNAQIYLSETRK